MQIRIRHEFVANQATTVGHHRPVNVALCSNDSASRVRQRILIGPNAHTSDERRNISDKPSVLRFQISCGAGTISTTAPVDDYNRSEFEHETQFE